MLKKDFQIFLESRKLEDFVEPVSLDKLYADDTLDTNLYDNLKVFYKYICDNIRSKFDINKILNDKNERDGFDREYISYDANVFDDVSLDRIHIIFDRHKLALDSKVVCLKYYLYLGSIETIRHGMSHIFLYGCFEPIQFRKNIYKFVTEIIPFRLVNKYEYYAPIYKESPRLIEGKTYLQSIERIDMRNPITYNSYNIFENTIKEINKGLKDPLSDSINSYIRDAR